eukprot:COSAG06_NODE_546_length_14441_cov_126.817947_3_plen_75_part_00
MLVCLLSLWDILLLGLVLLLLLLPSLSALLALRYGDIKAMEYGMGKIKDNFERVLYLPSAKHRLGRGGRGFLNR